jgi:hypothetical protein
LWTSVPFLWPPKPTVNCASGAEQPTSTPPLAFETPRQRPVASGCREAMVSPLIVQYWFVQASTPHGHALTGLPASGRA